MDDLISRQAVLDSLHHKFTDGFESDKWWNSTHVLGAINEVPPTTPQAKVDKALNLFVEWAVECGFGYDNIPEEYEKYKDDIAEMGYREGLVYIVKMESEAQE